MSPTNLNIRLPTNAALYLAGQRVSSTDDMISLYQRRITAMGMSPAMMFYNSDTQHRDKLCAFAHVLWRYQGCTDSVIDVGCGYGQLVSYLPDVPYLGVDAVPAMVAAARLRYPRREFVCHDATSVTRSAAWAALVGVLNSVPNVEELLAAAWRLCSTALVADVIRHGTLPETFSDLNRFRSSLVATYLRRLGARRIEVAAHSKYWRILVAWK